jgi:septum formation protein
MKKITLASASPRRKLLLEEAGFEVFVSPSNVDENVTEDLSPHGVAMHLAEIKCEGHEQVRKAELLVTADTIVVLDDAILNKPKNREEAISMLQRLSGRSHDVITGVCICTPKRKEVFHEITNVEFVQLDQSDIEYYVDTFKPYDKAGSYGIQEWIGYRGVRGINGSYYNVMGFPVSKFCEVLKTMGI